MARLACLSIPALPLQLLLRSHPEWQREPVVVVAEEKTQGAILHVNSVAARAGVQPGWRYGLALSLVPNLRAGVILPETLAVETTALSDRLRLFTPHVEPAPSQPGVFWLEATRLARVYPSLKAWAEAVLRSVREGGLGAAVVVGFSRFGTYAASAQMGLGVTVFPGRQAEQDAAWSVPLARLDFDSKILERFTHLGIHTVGKFAELPEAGILERFGAGVHRLHSLASGAWAPGLDPLPLQKQATETIQLEDPETDRTALLFLIKGRVRTLLPVLAARREGLAELELVLRLEGMPERKERVRPSVPTLDLALITDLVRLRLESLTLEQGVIGLELKAQGSPAQTEQLRLFTEHPRRELRAGERALARLRAEFGNEVVVRAELREGHLPEAQFAWVPAERMTFPSQPKESGAPAGERALVRRLFSKGRPWGEWQQKAPSALRWKVGPYPISGRWWVSELRRDYFYAETKQGELLWLYRDPEQPGWFLHGKVE